MEATVLRSHEEAHARALVFMGAGATQIPWPARGPTQNSWESARSAESADSAGTPEFAFSRSNQLSNQ